MHRKFRPDVISNVDLLKENYARIQRSLHDGIALFGAGQFGEASLRYLKKNNYNVLCFIDNSPQKQGGAIGGIPVVSSDHQLATSAGVILITAKHAVIKIKEQIGNKISNISFDAWFALKNIDKYEHFRNNVLGDERSRQCLDGILLAMLTGNEKYCAEIMDFNQYFCLPQFVNSSNEYFVDAGAYVGDTIEKFIWANNGGFKHIYAFEPGEKQFNALVKRKERLVSEWALESESITLINGGFADRDGEYYINDNSSMLQSVTLSKKLLGQDLLSVKTYSIDSYFNDKPITFIKADIEGMEVAMLHGAEETIKKNRPKMALSVYHEPNDLFDIIEFLFCIVPNYKMALRHHSSVLMETTLYCWIE